MSEILLPTTMPQINEVSTSSVSMKGQPLSDFKEIKIKKPAKS